MDGELRDRNMRAGVLVASIAIIVFGFAFLAAHAYVS